MFGRFFLFLVVLAIIIPGHAQTLPTSPKTTRTDNQRKIASDKESAITALEPLLDEIREVEDLQDRVTLADAVISLLSKRQPQRCRKLLDSLFDESLRLKKDQGDQDKSKKLDTDSLVRRIIQISASFDRKLAQSFVEKYAADNSLDDGQNSARDGRVSLTKFYLATATQLAEKDPALAASIAERSGFAPVIPETLIFLGTLREKDPAIANRLFMSALRALQFRGGKDPNELLLLFAFVFSPRQIPLVTPQARLAVYSLPGSASWQEHPVDLGLAGQYLDATVQLLLDPTRYDKGLEQPSLRLVGDWFLIRIIEPKTIVYRRELADSLLAQQYVLEAQLQSGLRNEGQASLDRLNGQPSSRNQGSASSEAVDDLLKRAEQTSDSKRRDQILYRAARAAVRAQEYDRALEIADKVSSEYQKDAKDFITVEIALSALGRQQVEHATLSAEKVTDLLGRAYLFTLIAKYVIDRGGKDTAQVRLLSSAVEELLPKLANEKERLAALTGLAEIHAGFDKAEAFRFLEAAIDSANKVDSFSGDTSVSRGVDISGFYYDYSLYTDLKFSEAVNTLGRVDFNATLEDVRRLQSRTARLRAITAACASVLSKKT
jgi:tetratricopeptide (TPR) repeat protein